MEGGCEGEVRLLLCRHGETSCNVRGILQGQRESELTPAGLRQASMLGARLAHMPIANLCRTIYSSDLSRARDTAFAVANALQEEGLTCMLKTDARFRERSLGPFQGLTATECDQQHKAAWRAYRLGASREELDAVGARGVEDDEELASRATTGKWG